MDRKSLARSRRWVVKVGSSLVTASGRGLDSDAIADWSGQLAKLRVEGKETAWVSSGAVAEGMVRLGYKQRPERLRDLQAAAAVGQMGLVRAYESALNAYGLKTAQILLTHDDIAYRARYLNARGALQTLIALGVIPIVNENDTVATDEIRFGDNDTLGALTCNLIDADLLIILTDQEGLYASDPRDYPDAEMISQVAIDDPRLASMAGNSRGLLGKGGMLTKIKAAQWAARSGTATVIAHGRTPDVLLRIAAGEPVGTLITSRQDTMAARKRWIAHQHVARGSVHIDAGAAKVLKESGRSLLPVGVTRIEGDFLRGDLVRCFDPDGCEVARGLVNYSADEAERIRGRTSAKLPVLLGYRGDEELIHRDNLVLSTFVESRNR